MKAIRTYLIGLMMLIGTSAFAQPMNYNAIRNNARFLTDRMAYTLGITNPVLIDDIYRINFDYIYGVNDYLDDVALGYRYDDYMMICEERDYALRMLLGDVLWSRIIGYDYFYRPIMFENHRWRFGIYIHDYDRSHFYFGVPSYYDGGYRGGHFFGGMHPHRGIGDRGPGMANWGPRQANPNRGGYPNGGYRGDNRGNGYHGGQPNGGNRGDMNRGDNRGNGYQGGQPNGGNRGDMNRGDNRGNGYQGGQPNNGNRGDMNHGGMNRNDNRNSDNRGGANPGGSTTNRGDMNRGGSSRSEGNSRSSSRSGSFGGGAVRSNSGNVSRGGNTGGASRGGNAGGGASRGGVTNGRR